MDDTRVDRLSQVDSVTPTRRAFTQILARVSLAGGLISLLDPAGAQAKKKRHKNKKKTCKSGTKRCDGKCITDTHCCGGCAYYPGLKCCGGRCANCCAGTDCESGLCVHGVCLAEVEGDCPPSLAALKREMGGWSCVYSDTTLPCADDEDCAFGSVCLVSNVCSTPGPLLE